MALSSSSRGLTKEQVRQQVPGYKGGQSDEAFTKMFQRDRDKIAKILNLPIKVTGSSDSPRYCVENNSEVLSLTEPEFKAIKGAISLFAPEEDMREGWNSIVPFVAAPTSQVAYVPTSFAMMDKVWQVFEALKNRQIITFDYYSRYKGEVTRERSIAPYGLQVNDNAWYLRGLDMDKTEFRWFKINRIEGEIETITEPDFYEIPEDYELPELREDIPKVFPIVKIAPDKGRWLRARSLELLEGKDENGWITIRLYGDDISRWADELVRYGSGVVVLEPPQLREKVIEILSATAQLGGE